MSKRYSGKSFKDSSVMKKAKLTLKEKRKRTGKRAARIDGMDARQTERRWRISRINLHAHAQQRAPAHVQSPHLS